MSRDRQYLRRRFPWNQRSTCHKCGEFAYVVREMATTDPGELLVQFRCANGHTHTTAVDKVAT